MWTAVLLLVGIAILVAMGAYSIYLFIQLRKQKRLFEQARLARIARIKESIVIIENHHFTSGFSVGLG